VRGVAALAIAETASWGILHYAFGILLRPVANDLGVSEPAVAGAYSIALLAAGLSAAPAGRAVDRYGARAVMTIGAATASVALLVFAGARSTIVLYFVWGTIGVCQAAVLYEPAFAAITAWFESDRDRLRALQVVTIVAGLASTIANPLVARATTVFGWRTTAVLMSAVVLLVVVPLHASLPSMKRVTEASRRRHDDVGSLALVFAAHSFVSAGIAVHLITHLIDRGLSLSDAASLAGVMGVAQVGGRLGAGSLRAFSSQARIALLFGAQSVAVLAIAWGAPLAGIVLFGVSNGLMTLERATIVAERFGRERYGENSGRIARVGMITRAGAPFAVGWVRLHAGPTLAFSGLAALLALAALSFQLPLARRPTVH
jgi:MFS family permease